MTEVMQYFNENHTVLLVTIGMLLLLRTDIYFDKRMTQSLKTTLVMILLFSVVHYVEHWFGIQAEYSVWRSILTVMNYSIPPLIMARMILMYFRLDNRLIYAPAAINLLLCMISLYTGIVFSFTEDNLFRRGLLGYVPFIMDGLYLIYFTYLLIRSGFTGTREDRAMSGFLLFSGAFLIATPLIFAGNMDNIICEIIAIDLMIYYIFILHQMTKRDTLTKLLNRQSYYADLEKLEEKIAALILIDMNGLKEINDKEGHLAGDKALSTIADCMFRATGSGHRAYRIGGDEYVILCMRSDEARVQAVIKKLRALLAKTDYSCAMGYAMAEEGKPPESLYTEADKMMYADKLKYYETHKKYR